MGLENGCETSVWGTKCVLGLENVCWGSKTDETVVETCEEWFFFFSFLADWHCLLGYCWWSRLCGKVRIALSSPRWRLLLMNPALLLMEELLLLLLLL